MYIEQEDGCPSRLWWFAPAGDRSQVGYVNLGMLSDCGGIELGNGDSDASAIDIAIANAITQSARAIQMLVVDNYAAPFIPATE